MRPITGLLSLLVLALGLHAQNNKDPRYTPMCIGWYNVENLYDTIDGPNDDAEWLPSSAKRWNSERYHVKLGNLARVIGELAVDVHPDGAAALGLCEIENRSVLEDLVKQPAIADRHYQIVHEDGPDRRGVDVAFIYNPKYVSVYAHDTYTLTDPADTSFRTRDQLVVSGVMDGDTVHFIMAHWPSRRGGEKRSMPKRILAAELGRHIEDSLFARNPNARIIYMGDLNDDPVDPSVRKFLRSTSDKSQAVNGTLFNPMSALYENGIGSLAWNDSWNLFDQTILSPALVTGIGGKYHYYGVRVHNKPYLQQPDGNFKGYPFRIYVGDTFTGGYSDHFAVFVILVKEAR
jgi:hypothetical protein